MFSFFRLFQKVQQLRHTLLVVTKYDTLRHTATQYNTEYRALQLYRFFHAIRRYSLFLGG